MSHYFSNDPNLIDNFHDVTFQIQGTDFVLYSNSGVFSKNALDFGSQLLIETLLKETIVGNILDVGCGIGVIGLVLATFYKDSVVTLIDVNERAVNVTKKNIERLQLTNANAFESDLFTNVEGRFQNIVTNPPIRAGKRVVYGIFEQAYDHLSDDGSLFVVIRKEQGAPSAMKKLDEIFHNVTLVERKKGYFILKCKKIRE